MFMIVKIIAAILGLAVGTAQFFLTSRVTASFLGQKPGRGILFLAAKMLVYVGMIWMVDWRVGLAATVIFLLVLFTIKYMSLASMILAAVSPVFLIIAGADSNMVIFLCALSSVLMIFRHRANIVRLARHEESRFTVRKKHTEG